jgi:hypothetical protein
MFSLMTDEYDSLSGAFQSPHDTTTVPLLATTIAEAIVEVRQLWAARKLYRAGFPPQVFPRSPRLVCDLDDLT